MHFSDKHFYKQLGNMYNMGFPKFHLLKKEEEEGGEDVADFIFDHFFLSFML